MAETLWYILTCAWYIFLMIPLVGASILVLAMIIAGLCGIAMCWIKPMFTKNKE